MVQEMTQFSSQTLSYDSANILPHFKTERQFVTPWESPQIPSHDDLVSTENPLPRASDGSPPQMSIPEAPAPATASKRKPRKRKSDGTYKHVPHREKPSHLVARRNARERRRVQAVTTAFSRLRMCVPMENRNKRLSKVKTLNRAIEYIRMLQEMLEKADEQLGSSELCLMTADADTLNNVNEIKQSWLPLATDWEEDNQNSYLSYYDDFSDPMQNYFF